MLNNRQQSGRRRGRGGQRPQGGGRGPESGNRIDNRARGNAAQLHEKYKTLARDAQQAGDRVLTEYYHQFADHYFRVLAESRARSEENQAPRRQQGDYAAGDDHNFDGDEGFESDDGDDFNRQQQRPSPQQQRYARDDQDGGDNRNNDNRSNENRADGDRQEGGDNRPRRDRGDYADRRPNGNANGNGRDYEGNRAPRDADAPREDRPVREPYQQRDARPNEARPAEARPPRRERRPDRDEAPEQSTLSIDQLPPAFAPEPGVEGEIVVPKRRGRPRKTVDEAGTEG